MRKSKKFSKSKVSKVRLIWALDLTKPQLKELRDRVDAVVSGENHALLTNYEVHWEEIPVDPSGSRLVWSDDASKAEMDELSDCVDMALVDPDFSIVVNYKVNWKELPKK